MKYESHEKLKAKLKSLGLTGRDVANAMDCPPGTASNRLNGFIPLLPAHRMKINKLIEETEKYLHD